MQIKKNWPGLVTVFYLFIIFSMCVVRRTELFDLKLNELGDFLAGVFGLLAFFWIVRGYWLQDKALEVSAKSFNQQAALFQQQTIAFRLENEPAFYLHCGSVLKSADVVKLGITFENRGADASQISVERSVGADFVTIMNNSLIKRSGSFYTVIDVKKSDEAIDVHLPMSYKDPAGIFHNKLFIISNISGTMPTISMRADLTF